ncbi:MAG: NUDIX domain-containing protein, partial [Alphaproteobacteria bacterium]
RIDGLEHLDELGRRAAAVDGNVERVMARLFAVTAPLPAAKPELRTRAERLVPEYRSGDFAQALMDLGATVCKPRAPLCGMCPLSISCEARARGIEKDLPRRQRKAAKPVRHGTAFWLRRADGAVLLRRRPEEGLLGGMMEVPGTPWVEDAPDAAEARRHAPARARWSPLEGEVRHTFTHFHLRLSVMTAQLRVRANPEGIWAHPDEFDNYALPTVMKKVVRHVLEAGK